METPASDTLAALWRLAGLPAAALGQVDLPGKGPVLRSSFNITAATQASLAAAALAAAELWQLRTGGAERQRVTVDATHAVLESCGHFTLDGQVPPLWDKLSGLYPCGAALGQPGWVRMHANFAHHRDRALRVLGCAEGESTEREAVSAALAHWRAEDFETAAAQAGAVVAALRDFAAWDAHPQAHALRGVPPLSIRPIAGLPHARPRAWSTLDSDAQPLSGLRVLDLTRILAGPVAGRTLAAYGADVMLVNSPQLPNISAIADTSRGKLSTHIDLKQPEGVRTLQALLADAHVFMQGYRPGGLADLGFDAPALARLRPGIVCVELCAYGFDGPWAGRRGFDSLVQSATGFNLAEAQAFGADQPQAMPLQVLDYCAGYLLALGAQAALHRQACEGGSWQVQVSLAAVATWLRGLGRSDPAAGAARPDFTLSLDEASDSGFGRLVALRHAAQFSRTASRWTRVSMPPGSHPPRWPG
jgi:CoA-transferase family III